MSEIKKESEGKAKLTLHEIEINRKLNEERIDALLQEGGGEITEEVDALMDEIITQEFAIANKLDGYGYLIESQKSRAEVIAGRIRALQARKRVEENKTARMKERLHRFLVSRNEKKISGDLFTFRRQMAGGVRALVIAEGKDLNTLPTMFTCQTTTINQDAVREFLADGKQSLEWASLAPKKEILVIK